MGRQVAFYMTAEDETELLRFLRRNGDVAILPNDCARSGFPELPALPIPESGKGWYIINLVPRSAIDKIQYRFVKDDLFIIDKNESPVVEWVRSMQRGSKLKEGRFWIGGTPASRNDQAVTLYEDLQKWLRRNCTRAERGGMFVGPGAARWVAQGGQLIFMQEKW